MCMNELFEIVFTLILWIVYGFELVLNILAYLGLWFVAIYYDHIFARKQGILQVKFINYVDSKSYLYVFSFIFCTIPPLLVKFMFL